MEYKLVCIGCGGIFAGYIPSLLHLHETGTIRFAKILLVDGKTFRSAHRSRQAFREERNKAEDLWDLWQERFPAVPLAYLPAYVDRRTVADIVPNGWIVFLSPDNHATRKLVSDHAETLDDILLITGSNDGMNLLTGEDGTEGVVIAHWKTGKNDRTPPITRHHPEIASPADRHPEELSCEELLQSYPQLLATNLFVGQGMVQMLCRYVLLPPAEAVQVVEMGLNSRDGSLVPYGLSERSLSQKGERP